MRVFSSIAILSILFVSVVCFADLNLDPEYSDPSSNSESGDLLLTSEIDDPFYGAGSSDLPTNIFSDDGSENLESALSDTTSAGITDGNENILIDDQQNSGPLLLASDDCIPDKTNRKRGSGICPPGYSRPNLIQDTDGVQGQSKAPSTRHADDPPEYQGHKVTAPSEDKDACSDQGSGYSDSRTPMCHDGIHGVVKLRKSRGVNLYGGHFCTLELIFRSIISPKQALQPV